MTAATFERTDPAPQAEQVAARTVYVEAEYSGSGLDVLPADSHPREVDGAVVVRDELTGTVVITKQVEWDADEDPFMFLATEEALHDYQGILQMIGKADGTFVPFRYHVLDSEAYVQVFLRTTAEEG